MGYDKRWTKIAEQWIYDSEISINRQQVEPLTPVLAQELQNAAEQFIAQQRLIDALEKMPAGSGEYWKH